MKRMTSGRRALLTIILMIAVIAVFLLPVAGWAFILSPENSLPNDPGKFNGMWWGQLLDEVKGMRLASYGATNSGELYYVRQGDVLQMGDAKLEYVQYGFWKGIYSSVAFGTKGAENWEALRNICFGNFEDWHKPNTYVEKYYWVGKHSAMTLEYNEAESTGQLYVYSKVIYERQLAQKQQGAGSRSGKGFWLWH